ncbi:MCE family protein [Nocardioides ginsengisoli]|uniref:MCE family protein n=1 Tax=Nocardioides ginsengisoli TaxID=363868 RepID=A0ABW3W119_9ACTN
MSRARDALLGLGHVLLVVLIAVATWLFYVQAFAARSEIRLATGTVGNALQKGSDVKLHGVPVGTVTAVEPRDGGATLTLSVQPAALRELSADTTARLLPKTLFGERYVALLPDHATSARLEPGATIHQDGSDEAVELEQVLDQLLPVLKAIQPDRLSAMLGEFATMLRGNGGALGDTIAAWGRYLAKLNPLTPQMADDLAAFGRVAQTYTDAAPDLVEALDAMTTTSRTLVDERSQLADAFDTVTTAADRSNGWLAHNSDTIIRLSATSRRAMAALAPYASEFPCTLKALRDYIPVMNKTLGKGTRQPGMHVVLTVEPSRGRYVAGQDDPSYSAGGGPRCPYETGKVGPVPARASAEPATIGAPPTSRFRQFSAATGLGEANSPAENRLLAELLAPSAGLAPRAFPSWSSLLLGPTLRGAEVRVR